jgi:hypothetical protein
VRVCQVTGDPSEQILAGIEEATGTRPDGCPWQSFRDPFVGEVLRAYRHWKAQQLTLVWGDDPPAALMRGIEVYDSALNAVQAHDIRKERERRDEDRKRRESADMQKRVGRRRA